MFNIVKRFFDKNIYTVDDVRKFVNAGKLTEEEFIKITEQKVTVIDFPSDENIKN